MSWGVANVLFGLCVIRIGAALSGALLTATGVCVGVTMPMLFKASGLFSNASDIKSPAGLTVLLGVAIMVIGVIMVTIAGFGRERTAKKTDEQKSAGGGFLLGLVLSICAGVLSSGISFAFIYSQAPIVNAMKAQGASDVSANIAVWAAGLVGGALVNVLYAAYLMTKNKNWNALWRWPGDAFVASFFGIQFIVAMVLLGKGMVWLGVLGASVGFGIQQTMQILGSQAVGFISGEWRGVHKNARNGERP
jgi:L-rhamnose-H+ transport protein